MAVNDAYSSLLSHKGFQKWIKTSVDDFELIKPPRQHILAYVTGGLSHLYKLIKDDKRKRGRSEENGLKGDGTISEKGKETKKRDDEGGGYNSEEEETSPYTNMEGEFVPDETLHLLSSRYKFVKLIAQGQSAVIIEALDTFMKDIPVAIKVLHRVYKPIGSQEADILLELHRADPWLHVPFARLQNQFIYGPHYCLVFNFLCPSEVKNIKDLKNLSSIRYLCVKLLTVLGFLEKQNVIHADLKPENILLVNEDDAQSAMVIDFGNALRNTEDELAVYYSDYELQTLLYRAPEVFFGLQLGFEIDMWSLGCLLAECYTSQPLFVGQTKMGILEKMTELLGPLPTEFSRGDYSEEFAEFIGEPLSRHDRITNLRRHLDNCQDINFLLLIESLLTYSPSKRLTPFEAACHPFIASANPCMYLVPDQKRKRYPIVLLDQSTYPYLPSPTDETSLDETSAEVVKRLTSYRHRESENASANAHSNEESPENKAKSSDGNGDAEKASSRDGENQSGKSPQPTDPADSSLKSTERDGERSDGEDGDSSVSLQEERQITRPKPRYAPGGPVADLTRTDVKQTLKSMGLRCEDFTISVFPKDEAHAILRKKGVDVNHVGSAGGPAPVHRPPQIVQPRPRAPQPLGRPPLRFGSRPNFPLNSFGPRQRFSSLGRPPLRRNVAFPPVAPPSAARATRPPQQVNEDDDDDDDDCVILDPPEGAKRPPQRPQPPPRRYVQQFQLMGTTVQVNRGAKRPLRTQGNAPNSKRPHFGSPFNRRGMNPRGGGLSSSYDDNTEVSVQDTLKRLKNYNISITCRRNVAPSSNRGGSPDSDSDDGDGDGGHYDSGDEEDVARFLECEIGEDEQANHDEESYDGELFNFDSSGCHSGIVENHPGENRDWRNRRMPPAHSIRKTKSEVDKKLNSTVELDEGDSNDDESSDRLATDQKNAPEYQEDPAADDAGNKSNEDCGEQPMAAMDYNGDVDHDDASGGEHDEDPLKLNDAVKNELEEDKPSDVDMNNIKDVTPQREEIGDTSPSENKNVIDKEIAQMDDDALAKEELNDNVERDSSDQPREKGVSSPSPADLKANSNSDPIEDENALLVPSGKPEGTEGPSPEKLKNNVCVDSLDDVINEELEEQLLGANNLFDDDFENE